MRDVTLVQVVGPPGGGKTTLIERVLRSSPSRLLAAVRIVPDEAVRAPVVDPAGDADTVRYAAAGAWSSLRVLVPAGAPCDVFDALDACEGACHPASAILIEGGRVRRGDVDAVVFVTAPLPAGVGLTVVETREVGRLDGRDALGERILELLEHGYPVRQEVTELRPGFEGLAEAQLAVVSAGDAASDPWCSVSTSVSSMSKRTASRPVRRASRPRPNSGHAVAA